MARKINYDNWSKEELAKELRRIKETKYGLVWHRDLPEEKIDTLINPDARTPNEMFPNEMAGRPFPILKETKGKEINGDKGKPVNLLIEGDNYHSLAVLNFTHQEAIDLIYIDPPYNTGENDFIYNDKMVDKEDPFRHSKWLSFMEKRLKLAKNLLKSDGVLFVSIDDNEQAPLKLLCDEIFDDGHFLGTLTWINKTKPVNSGKAKYQIQQNTEYIFAYSKTKREDFLGFDLTKQGERKYALSDQGGDYRLIDIEDSDRGRKKRDTMKFEILGIKPGTGKRWKIGQLEINNLIKTGRIVKVEGKIKRKIYSYEESGFVENPFWSHLEAVGTAEDGKKELSDIIGQDHGFDTVKPVNLIESLLQHFTKNVCVLDFFAGSGSTGQAVLDLNKEGGNRRFILCTNNDNNICLDVCYPRLKKVIKGYKNTKGENIAGLGGNLKYYTCDFVEAEPTDQNKRKLVSESTEMLCIRENAFDLVQDESDFKIFKNEKKYLGIVFYEEAIGDFKKAIKKIKGHFNTYVFSLGDEPHEKQFTDVKRKVTLCAIPEVILKVYREIFK
ncbi:MAG: site-specific DNA-methyltransferase [Patescibacteria group bacterium]|jgi:adenine-specific DNA-methyltransferase